MNRARTMGIMLFMLISMGIGVHVADAAKNIRFAAGSNSATIEGAVIRGERNLYHITARSGQTMQVSISSVEDNAVFAIFMPGAKARMEDGATEISGASLPNAGETDDATKWEGKLPASGKYTIVVGGTRGNATYKLKVTIH